jgi:hypothetical protein
VIDELNDKVIVTKKRPIADRIAGGIPFTYGPLAYLLRNRTYLGETGHGGQWFPGEHETIIARGLFEEVQRLLKSNSAGCKGRRHKSNALLIGVLFDDRGNRMSPSFSTKAGARYPFYVSSALLRGRRSEAGIVTRLSATEIEGAVVRAVREHAQLVGEQSGVTQRQLIDQTVKRMVVGPERITLTLKANSSPIEIPWAPSKKKGQIQIEQNSPADHERTPNLQLIQAVVRAHIWRRSLADGTYDDVEDLARAAGLHPKVVRNKIRLAFLAPDVIGKILGGRQPVSMTVRHLSQLDDLSWREHARRLQAGA